jgi:hypothetical protein
MSPADSAAALSGVFRITLLTGPSSDLATGRRGLFWLTALRHATTAAPSNSWENRRGIELIGEAAWGANARAPWQLDPWWLGSWPNAQRPHALAYANGSITEGEYAATDVMYKSYAIQSLGPRSFSGTWHQRRARDRE